MNRIHEAGISKKSGKMVGTLSHFRKSNSNRYDLSLQKTERLGIAAISRMKLPNPQFPALSEYKSVCGRRIIFDPTTPLPQTKRLEPLATLSLFPYKMF